MAVIISKGLLNLSVINTKREVERGKRDIGDFYNGHSDDAFVACDNATNFRERMFQGANSLKRGKHKCRKTRKSTHCGR